MKNASPWVTRQSTRLGDYGLATLACALITALTAQLTTVLAAANIVMLYLLAVFCVAVWLGRGPAVLAAFLAVALFDFFQVPPHYSFSVANAEYLLTFAVMLTVGLTTAQLVSTIAAHTRAVQRSAQESQQLLEAARSMAGALEFAQIQQAVTRFLASRDMQGKLLIADEGGALQVVDDAPQSALEHGFAQSALLRNEPICTDTLSGMGVAVLYLPLAAAAQVRGVLAIQPNFDDNERLAAQRETLQAIASLCALAVERCRLSNEAQRTEIQLTEERLRASVLSALSHDLRTPLTTLVGLADQIIEDATAQKTPSPLVAAAHTLRAQAYAMHRMIDDLLDMARLQAGATHLRCEWQSLEEVIGSSLRQCEASGRQVTLYLPADLPLLNFDAVLIERVLCNLLDNAFKYSAPTAQVSLTANVRADAVELAVKNDGAGFPPQRIAAMFEVFTRGVDESRIAGAGLGLSICKAIVEAHGGHIHAENLPDGAAVRFTLPRTTPPQLEEEETAP